MFGQPIHIRFERLELEYLHSALKPAHQGLFLILAEIVASMRMQCVQDR